MQTGTQLEQITEGKGLDQGNWRANGDTIGADHRGKGAGAGTQACKLTSLEVVLLWRGQIERHV